MGMYNWNPPEYAHRIDTAAVRQKSPQTFTQDPTDAQFDVPLLQRLSAAQTTVPKPPAYRRLTRMYDFWGLPLKIQIGENIVKISYGCM